MKQASAINHLLAEEKHKSGISNDLLAVLTCVDRTQSNFTKSCCLGRITTNDISTDLKDCFTEDTVLVTDSHSAYRGYAKANTEKLINWLVKKSNYLQEKIMEKHCYHLTQRD